MNLIVIAIIVLVIFLISREPKSDRRRGRHSPPPQDMRRIDELSHRVGVLEEILLDRERRLRDKFRDL